MKQAKITLSEKEAVGIMTALAIVDYLGAMKFEDVTELMHGIAVNWGPEYWTNFRARFNQWTTDHDMGEDEPNWWVEK